MEEFKSIFLGLKLFHMFRIKKPPEQSSKSQCSIKKEKQLPIGIGLRTFAATLYDLSYPQYGCLA